MSIKQSTRSAVAVGHFMIGEMPERALWTILGLSALLMLLTRLKR